MSLSVCSGFLILHFAIYVKEDFVLAFVFHEDQVLSDSNFPVNLVRFSNLAFVGQVGAFQRVTLLNNKSMTWLLSKTINETDE